MELTKNKEKKTNGIKNKSSKYTGVHWNKHTKKWRAEITIKGNKKYLGLFTNEEEANEAYQKALIQIKKGTPKNIEVKKAVFSSKYKGVHWNKSEGKWKVEITIKGNRKYLGLFTNEEEANEAYQKALKALN